MTSSSPTTPSNPTPRSRSASVSATSINGCIMITNANAPPMPPVPHSTATHSSFIPSRYVKHATLINNCYPARPEEKGPKSSELSYLVFYATSKPAKLTKVGSFIERRVARDYRKRRLSDVHCSLGIIKALILSSKAHLNIFSKNVIVILDTLLVDISDFDIVRHCQIVFSCFCAAHDGSTLGVDPEFKTLYDHVVARFADIAMLKGDGINRYRSVGLKAVEGVASSSALYAYDHQAQLNLVLPPILGCLIDFEDGLQISLEERPHPSAERPRRSMSIHGTTDPEKEVGDDDVIIARIDSVETTTLDMALRLQKRVTLVSALDVTLFSPLTLVGMPVLEVLNSLLTALTKSLAASSSFSKEGESSQLLVLETLIQDGIVRSVGKYRFLSTEHHSLGILAVMIYTIYTLTASLVFFHKTGGLATHIYYTNQVPHIISHIVGKLSYKIDVVPQPETIEGVPTVEYRKILLRCLTAAIKTSKEHGRQASSVHASEISSELLTPCLGLLLDNNVGVRTAFAQSLITFLATEDEGHGQGTSLGGTLPAVSSDLYFRAAAHQTLHTYARLPTATPTDMAAVYGILRALFTHFQDDEFMRVVPVLFSLQDWCVQLDSSGDQGAGAQDVTNLVARKRALATVIVIYLQKAVSSYNMAEPREYLDNIKNSRENENQWYPIYYDNQECLTRTTTHQWETPSEPFNPVLSHPLAREHLVTLLTTVSDRFRAGADRFGFTYNPETQSSFLSTQDNNNEVGSSQFLSPFANNGHGLLGHKPQRSVDSRIRVSRHLEEWALPKMMPVSSPPSNDMISAKEEASTDSTQISRQDSYQDLANGSASTQSHKTIGVDNLKAALSHMHLDMNGDTNSSTAGSETRGPSPIGHR
ncbi:plasma membrane localization protein, partial [Modicella reniformis]